MTDTPRHDDCVICKAEDYPDDFGQQELPKSLRWTPALFAFFVTLAALAAGFWMWTEFIQWAAGR